MSGYFITTPGTYLCILLMKRAYQNTFYSHPSVTYLCMLLLPVHPFLLQVPTWFSTMYIFNQWPTFQGGCERRGQPLPWQDLKFFLTPIWYTALVSWIITTASVPENHSPATTWMITKQSKLVCTCCNFFLDDITKLRNCNIKTM